MTVQELKEKLRDLDDELVVEVMGYSSCWTIPATEVNVIEGEPGKPPYVEVL